MTMLFGTIQANATKERIEELADVYSKYSPNYFVEDDVEEETETNYWFYPFVCKMTRYGSANVHIEEPRFPNRKQLELHVNTVHADILKYVKQSKDSYEPNSYLCPWKGCNEPHEDLALLKGIK